MNIQLALDRMTIDEAIKMAKQVEQYIDWIEVGTSLIKEYGMESVKSLKAAFPDKTIVADIKTMDNAKYEFKLCFEAGADVATVMGVAPDATIQTCMETAADYGKHVMIDLLNTTEKRAETLSETYDAILCVHVSKDQQEIEGQSTTSIRIPGNLHPESLIAAAGGITSKTLSELVTLKPHVVIVGSAITKTAHSVESAKQMKEIIKG
ncbi:3-hexulose-6-phosphate synthase [Scopulibacillus darangshiensis]|uniref:3-hexulose-6-phosphate synthase n=1 Tax=Scopulibacillus darangshiensis TaxID=442528 RepID=A0A4V2SL60_9BACL|nr:3-hexulose-6-phosphate synthase [Scopulibacillus darangshiensis]TCP22126.1 3-hexulose-6-phosphate synthase [Scopulibacillus darangshiensis]